MSCLLFTGSPPYPSCRYIFSMLVSPFHDSLDATSGVIPRIAQATGYSSRFGIEASVKNPTGLYSQLTTKYLPSTKRSRQYGIYTDKKLPRAIIILFVKVKEAIYSISRISTNYSAAPVRLKAGSAGEPVFHISSLWPAAAVFLALTVAAVLFGDCDA